MNSDRRRTRGQNENPQTQNNDSQLGEDTSPSQEMETQTSTTQEVETQTTDTKDTEFQTPSLHKDEPQTPNSENTQETNLTQETQETVTKDELQVTPLGEGKESIDNLSYLMYKATKKYGSQPIVNIPNKINKTRDTQTFFTTEQNPLPQANDTLARQLSDPHFSKAIVREPKIIITDDQVTRIIEKLALRFAHTKKLID